MKKLFPILVLILGLWSCQDQEGPRACGTENPIEDLAWLKNLITEIEGYSLSEYNYVVQSTYRGKTIFLVQSCCPFCSYAVPIFDCQGNSLGYIGQQDGIQPDDVKEGKVIWKPENSQCAFTQN
ncbi:hypothetical protein DFQ04_0681 [Algoriphagus boseongensis]|uniref:WG repeat protein n=1 Tax=Algoriphagus boseongensis TaxID=1442587 RepID=A0A4R6T845_9BACT|nr:hypothetical protein [Algoriphagus boseongensis]TDQ18871.1 hypothetical protein DFQ04_0681 [Algoriphagus boseongensis]